MRIVSAFGPNVTYALSAARKALGVTFHQAREVLRSGSGDDGLWRSTLSNGDVVETTVIRNHAAGVDHIFVEPENSSSSFPLGLAFEQSRTEAEARAGIKHA